MSADTQGAGFYRWRAGRGAPFQAVRILENGGLWYVLVNGVLAAGSGAPDLHDIPFVHPPGSIGARMFHPVSEFEYLAILDAYDTAPADHPLRSPGTKVDLKAIPPLW